MSALAACSVWQGCVYVYVGTGAHRLCAALGVFRLSQRAPGKAQPDSARPCSRTPEFTIGFRGGTKG